MRRFTLKTVALALLGLFGAQGVCVQAQTWTGSTPSDANNKTVYLYNVGAGKFLGKGGRWGTEANLNYEGVPFTLTFSSSKFTLQSQVKAEAGTSTSSGYLQRMDGTSSTSVHDEGNFFVDRTTASSFTATKTADNTYFYTLQTTQNSTTYYMIGGGSGNVTSETTVDSASIAYSQWIIVTEEERRKAFESAEAANAQPVNATFLIYDYDFARNDNSVSVWKTGFEGAASLSYNISTVHKPTDAYASSTNPVKQYTHTYARKSEKSVIYSTITNIVDSATWAKAMPTAKFDDNTYTYSSCNEATSLTEGYTYYVGNGYANDSYNGKYDPLTLTEFTDEENRQAAFGGNWTANIHGASGAVQQTLESSNMVRKGYYRISCKAFTTATQGTVRLWAGSGEYSTDAESEKYAYTAIPAIDEAPETYVAASRTLETGGQTYDASVKVYVEDVSDRLKFGIYVDGAEETAWTCFDDFAIEYLGDPTTVLVLDEDQTNGKYINNQATKDGDELKTVKLYLHRSLNVDKWNSLVLPVDLTVGQVKSAFGDQVRISALEGATDETRPGTIIFKAITADRSNNNETAIKAGQLYLVKPTKAMPTEQAAVEFEVPGQTDKATITSYYTIVGVTYAHAADVKNTDYSKKVTGTQGDETYGSDTKVKFCGTYVKLGDTNLIPVNSYVLNGNNEGGTAGVWYYRTVQTASKGFRGWLETIEGETSTGIQYELDGVVEKVSTGIGDIVAKPNAISGNIYNLNGQLVRRNATSLEGLASGIYVAGGKKYVVK